MRRDSSGGQKEIAEIRDRLASQAVLCLVGPSGCGKSSLIQAGVLADLESTEPIRLGRSHSAARAARRCAPLGEALGAELDDATTAREVGRAAQQAIAAGSRPGRLLLVVDQLEELFAQAGADEQERFVAALDGDPRPRRRLDRARDPRRLLRRADGERVSGRSSRAARSTCRRSPATPSPRRSRSRRSRCHVTLEPDLLERLVADAGNEPGALPLLQEALVRLWGTMRLHRISLAAYESIGGERPRRPLGRRRRHGRRGARDALARRRCRSPSASSSASSSSARADPTRAASSGSRTCVARATTTRRSRTCSTSSPARAS